MNPLAATLLAGIVSAALYAVVITVGLGFLFLFIPTLPLFWLALTRRPDLCLRAGLVGMLVLSVFIGSVQAVFGYWLFLALPTWYMGKESLKRIGNQALILWFPLTIIFSHLMACFTVLLLAVVLFYMGTEGGLPGVIGPHIYEAFRALPPELTMLDMNAPDALQSVIPTLSFLVVSMSAWMWAACLYLHAWIVNRELLRQKIALRPDFAVMAVAPPSWLISLMVICAFASLVGGESLAFWGKVSLLVLLFPYFLFGLALLHMRSRALPSRVLLLFLFYILLAALLWPALLVAGYGVIRHLKALTF